MTIGKNNDTYLLMGVCVVVLAVIGYGVTVSFEPKDATSEIREGQAKLARELIELSQKNINAGQTRK